MISAWWAAAALAGALDRPVAIFPDSRAPASCCGDEPAAAEGAWGGGFVESWVVDLPGPRLNAPSRSERARPTVVGDLVLVGSAAGSGLFGLARADGTVQREWPSGAPVLSAPVVVGDRVYYADLGGVVRCATLDGEPLWERDLGFPIVSSPAVSNGAVWVATVSDLAASLDAHSGALQWQYQRRPDLGRIGDLALYARPTPVASGSSVLFGFSDGALVALDAQDGEPQWERRVGEGRYPDLVAEPLVIGADIVASGYFQPLVALDARSQTVRWRLEVGAASGASVFAAPSGERWLLHPGTDGKLRAIDVSTGDTRWTWSSGSDGALTTPVASEGGVWIGSSEGGLWLLDPADGTTRWTYDDRALLESVSAPVSVDGRDVYFVTGAGRLHALRAIASSSDRTSSSRWLRVGQSHPDRSPGVPRSPKP